jgi:hypothetical protein
MVMSKWGQFSTLFDMEDDVSGDLVVSDNDLE